MRRPARPSLCADLNCCSRLASRRQARFRAIRGTSVSTCSACQAVQLSPRTKGHCRSRPDTARTVRMCPRRGHISRRPCRFRLCTPGCVRAHRSCDPRPRTRPARQSPARWRQRGGSTSRLRRHESPQPSRRMEYHPCGQARSALARRQACRASAENPATGTSVRRYTAGWLDIPGRNPCSTSHGLPVRNIQASHIS